MATSATAEREVRVVLQEDDAGSPTLQKSSGAVFVSSSCRNAAVARSALCPSRGRRRQSNAARNGLRLFELSKRGRRLFERGRRLVEVGRAGTRSRRRIRRCPTGSCAACWTTSTRTTTSRASCGGFGGSSRSLGTKGCMALFGHSTLAQAHPWTRTSLRWHNCTWR